jgi:UDP-glucose 4-epimerase
MRLPCNVTHLDPRNEVKIAFSDHSKAEKVFGKREKKLLRDGIQAMAAWVSKHGTRESSIFEGIEVEKNMPPSWARVTKVRV